jgi:hypothetical protein
VKVRTDGAARRRPQRGQCECGGSRPSAYRQPHKPVSPDC